MRRIGSIVLFGTVLLAPAQLLAEQPRVRAGVGPYAEDCRTAGRRGTSACPARLDPIHVSSGRVRVFGAGRAWIGVDWGDLFIRRAGVRDRYEPISQGRLKRMLGRATVNRLRAVGRHAGLRGRLHGHWYMGSRRGAVLVVSMGWREIAQFVDRNRDGWVEAVLLRNNVQPRRTLTYREVG